VSYARDGNTGQRSALENAIGLAARPDLGQHRLIHSKERTQLVIPRQRLQVHKHGSAGVGNIGDKRAAVQPTRQVL